MDNFIATIIIGIVSFVGGFILGFISRGLRDKRGDVDNNSIVLLIVTFIWALSMIVDILSPTYETSPMVHGLMGAIVGFFYKPFQKGETKI